MVPQWSAFPDEKEKILDAKLRFFYGIVSKKSFF
jgi:hypothetical protein